MFFEKMKKNKKSAQYQLTKKFISIFLGILLGMNLIYLIASGSFVYEFVENKADGVLSTLENEIGKETDWESHIDGFVSEKEEDSLIIETEVGEIYYSEEAKEIFAELYPGKSLPFLKRIIFSDEDIYYVVTRDYGNFTAHLAISGETAAELVSGMLLINVLLNLVAIVLGSLIIYRSVKNWSQSLIQMSEEIKALDIVEKSEITVPDNPSEIKDVASAFNQLLVKQQEAMERERQFVTNASHDLKTPIAAIRGHVKLIKRRGESHPEIVSKSIDFIDKESKRLEKLSQQLLLLDLTNNHLPKEWVHFSELVLDEVERAQELHHREFITYIDKEIQVYAFLSDMQQVVQNLIENAIKYSFEHTSITIILKEQENQIVFTVIDEGIGIKDEAKQRVFERFYRGDDSRTSHIEGSGIGLAIVKNILESNSASIDIQNNQPRGSIFIVKFPIET